MNENNQLDVTGTDPWELLAALHNASRVPQTLVCMVQARGNITADEARDEAQSGVRDDYQMSNGVPFWPDYLFGRMIKSFLMRRGDSVFLCRTDLYDRDVGDGAAQRVVNSLRASQ